MVHENGAGEQGRAHPGPGELCKGFCKEPHHPICILESSLWLQRGTLEQDGREVGRSMDSVDANHGPDPC